MQKNMEELTLLLMYLTSREDKTNSFEEKFKRSWKKYDFDILNELTKNGYRIAT